MPLTRDQINARERAYYHRTKYARRQKLRAEQNRRYAKHRIKLLAKNKAYRAAHPEVTRRNSRDKLLRSFGLTSDQYDIMVTSQKGVCAICEKGCITGRRLCIDHDHKTGKVRALLCSKCNHGLGHFNDSIELLGKAAAYLKIWIPK